MRRISEVKVKRWDLKVNNSEKSASILKEGRVLREPQSHGVRQQVSEQHFLEIDINKEVY
jgi:hypothetical protein